MSVLLRECISGQNSKSVYLGKNGVWISDQMYSTKHYKILIFTNGGHHIRGENDEKLARP